MAVWKDAWDGNLKAVQSWVKANPGKKDSLSADRQCSLLYTAARAGNLQLVQWLVEDADCDMDVQNGENKSTPLHGAAFGGFPKVVEYLVEAGAALTENAFGDTPLDDCNNSEAKPKAKKACIEVLKKLKQPAKKTGAVQSLKRDESMSKKILTADKVPALTLVELKAELKSRSLSAVGKKAELVLRLQDELGGTKKKKKPDDDDDDEDEPPKKKAKIDKPTSKVQDDDDDDPLGVNELKNAKCTFEDIEKDTTAFWDMEEKLAASLQGRNEDYVQHRIKAKKKPLTFILVSCQKVKNPVLEKRFLERKKKMMAENKEYGRERTSFHGSSPKNVPSICRTSLLRFKHPLNPCKEQVDDGYFGTNKKGVYVSRYSDYTFKYACDQEPLDAGEKAKTIMFRTLPGKSKHIPKLAGAIDPTAGFHSHSSPSYLEWYLFNEDQLCPEYVLEVKAVEDTRTAADDE